MAKSVSIVSTVAKNDEEFALSECGEERMLPARLLRVDTAGYQRRLNDERVRHMVAHFDPRLCGRILVNQRGNGDYFIIDGQHRFAAMCARGVTIIPCVVFCGLTEPEEALLFAEWNGTQKRPTVYQVHRAKARGNDKDAQAINDILAEFGCELVERNATSGRYGRVACTSTVNNIYSGRYGGAEMLRTVMRIITSGWWDQLEGLQEDALRGVHGFVRRYSKDQNYREDKLIKAMQRTTARKVLDDAHYKAKVNRVLIFRQVVTELFDAYNHGAKAQYRIGAEDEGNEA